MEEWRDIIGYEGKYQVSNLGRVKSLNYRNSNKEKLLTPVKNEKGYLTVTLSKKGKSKHYKIHRLVAQAFIPNPDNLPEVNHIIDDFEHRSDNRVENLEWCTHEYNLNYGSRIERHAEAIKGKLVSEKHPNAKKVKCITTNEIFNTIREAGEKYNISCGNITSCCKGIYKSAGKHPVTGEKLVWEYV